MIWNDPGNWSTLWDEVDDLQSRLNRAFQSSRSYPEIRLYQKEHVALVQAEIPGIDPEDLSINAQDDILTLSFERKVEVKEEEVKILRSERPSGKFSRTIRLPFRVDANLVDARFKQGVLSVTLPMAEEEKPRKIAIQAS